MVWAKYAGSPDRPGQITMVMGIKTNCVSQSPEWLGANCQSAFCHNIEPDNRTTGKPIQRQSPIPSRLSPVCQAEPEHSKRNHVSKNKGAEQLTERTPSVELRD
jgi:hypothetical protein